jgi:hypothetical protein
MTLAAPYLDGDTRALASNGITTLQQLVDAANQTIAVRFRSRPPSTRSVYKRHLLVFLHERYSAVVINDRKMYRERVAQLTGEFPNQCIVLQPRASNLNNGLDDDEALALALRASMAVSPVVPPVVEAPSTVTTPLPPASDAMSWATADATPVELCCPITLELFHRPVQTIRGNTYEYAQISEWFEKGNKTDPMTGEALWITALFRNESMEKKCADYLDTPSPITTVPSTVGRGVPSGGRGRGRGGRGGRGRRGV